MPCDSWPINHARRGHRPLKSPYFGGGADLIYKTPAWPGKHVPLELQSLRLRVTSARWWGAEAFFKVIHLARCSSPQFCDGVSMVARARARVKALRSLTLRRSAVDGFDRSPLGYGLAMHRLLKIESMGPDSLIKTSLGIFDSTGTGYALTEFGARAVSDHRHEKAASIDQFRQRRSQTPATTYPSRASMCSQGC
jgi:hypothetical protein